MHNIDMEILVSSLLEKNQKELSDLPALINDEHIMTHLELHEQVEQMVQYLSSLNLPHDIIVALRFQNPIKHLVLHLALFKIRVCQISINPREIYNIQKKTISLASIGFVIQDIAPNNLLIPQTLYISDTWNPIISTFQWSMETISKSKEELEGMAQLVIGSGTTGEPKMFYLHSSSVAQRIKREAEAMNYQIGERYYAYSELHYSYPKHDAVGALLRGMTIVLPSKKPKFIIPFCKEQKIDHISMIGSQATVMLSQINTLEKYSSLILPNLKSLSLTSMLITEPIREKILGAITNNLYIKYGTNEFGECTLASPGCY